MLLRDLYYLVKPAIPRRIRAAVRGTVASRRRHRFSDCWPIDHMSGHAPASWRGWPDGKKFAFVLTHDVEGKRGLDRCRQLAELEKGLGVRSSFNFVPEGEYATPPSLRAFLDDAGFEVGVHDLHHDGKLYRSEQAFDRHAERINHYLSSWGAVGFRSAFMLHNLEWLQRLNVLYDTSTFDTDPFEPQPDGVNTVFPFLVQRKGADAYVELPYTLPQDSTLFLVLGESTIDVWTKKLDWLAARGGMALVNVHPDYMTFDREKRWSEYPADLYAQFLKYALHRYRDEAWFALPRDVAAHVRRHTVPSVRDLLTKTFLCHT
jgi:hypothetical protein